MRVTALIVSTTLIVGLSACGGESATVGDTTESTAPTIEGDGIDGDAVTSVAAETTAVLSTPVVTDPVSTAAPDTSGEPGDACLQGRWIAGQARMQAFISQLLPLAVTIEPGSSYDLQIDGTFFSSVNNVNVALSMPDGPTMRASGTGIISGTLAVDGNVLATTVESSEGGVYDWSAVIDGVAVDLPAPTDASGFTFDTNNASFVCDGDTLVLTDPTGRASVTFDRS
jgi:hypothetical protein